MTLYGLAEIAEALGVKVEKVRDWREAGHLPEPTQQLKAGYVWAGEDIEWWIEEQQQHPSEGGAGMIKRKPGEPKGQPTPKQVKRDMQHPKMQDRHLYGLEAGRRGSPGPREERA